VAVTSELGPPAGYPSPAEFERQPPQDIAAEQAVLGGMLLSKDAIADVVEVVRGADFYRPAHQTIYDTVVDLYGRGEPADPVTISAELTRTGLLTRVGGAPYLHTLMSSVPTAANAGYYAEIVAERAVLRRLIEAGTRIVQLGYGAAGGSGGDVDEVVDRAQAAVYEVTERRLSEDYIRLEQLLTETMDEIDLISTRGGVSNGVPTGFADLDGLTNGLHPGQMVIIAARPALGKALALDTPLPTPTGWTTMGAVRVGDYLIGADGRPTRVVAATEVITGRPCYGVEFADGEVVVADAEHLWKTTTPAFRQRVERATSQHRPPYIACSRQPPLKVLAPLNMPAERVTRPVHVGLARGHDRPVTTAEIAATLRCDDRSGAPLNHAVDLCGPLQLPERDLPLGPYLLGIWLGDESRRVCWRRDGTVVAILRTIGVVDHKHIPAEYLRASVPQRCALLAGLMDTAGTVTSSGRVQFMCASPRLAEDVRELVVSLGYRCEAGRKHVAGRSEATATAYTITFTANDEVFRREGKRRAHLARRGRHHQRWSNGRNITDVRRVASVPVRCVQVDNDSHLYLASRSMIPTHNSTLALDLARSCSIKNGQSSVIFSLEMGRTEITMRLLSAEAKVPLHHMRAGRMSDDDWARLARRMGEVAEAPLYIDDSPNLTLMEIRAKARRLKQRHDLRLVVVDYMQLMSSPRRVESRQQEVSEFSRALKLLAKELEVPVVALSQLNRGPEQRTDKRPMLSDLRESGCLTAETRILRADTGAEVSLGELLASGARDVPVWSLDDRLKLVPRTMTHVFPSGTREVFELRLTSGRSITATGNHPFLTYDGWQPLDRLTPGTRLGVPRHLPAPLALRPWADDEVVLLAHLIGDGSFVRRQPIRYASIDEANLTAVTEAARHFGVQAIRDEHPEARVTTLRLPAPYRLTHGRRNPIAAWLDDLGLFGLRSQENFVPDAVFGLPKSQVGLFLRHLWATDGSVRYDAAHRQARLCYVSTSRRLVEDLARLLLRFSVLSSVKRVRKAGYRDEYYLDVYGIEDQSRFLDEIGIHGARGEAAAVAAARVRQVRPNTSLDRNPSLETVPSEVWHRVRSVLADQRTTYRERAATGTAFRGSTVVTHSPSPTRLARVAALLDDADVEMLASNDVWWDTVASVDSIGERDVYDATVLGTHNFVADGIAVHNSLEQDADMVILLHREDAYEKESPRAGEADLILAKNRNGPTGTVTVAFQGHYSRFVDMQRGG